MRNRIVSALLVVSVSCGDDEALDGQGAAADGTGSTSIAATITAAATQTTGASSGGEDPRCTTEPVLVGQHPFAKDQPTESGRVVAEVKGFAGRLYAGYGDMDVNTGPVHVTSMDPADDTWADHLLVASEKIARYRRVGDRLFAPMTDPRGEQPDVEYAVAGADHVWAAFDVGVSLHAFDVIERVPGEIDLVGSMWGENTTPPLSSGAIWRSVDGGPFARVFPDTPSGIIDFYNGAFTGVGVVGGRLFVVSAGAPWMYDGAWSFRYDLDLGHFGKPLSFRDGIVFEALDSLWFFDGTGTTHLDVDLISAPFASIDALDAGIFDVDGEHLLVVTPDHEVHETTDLQTWRCIGSAPPGATSIGVLDGTVYFGATAAEVYRYPTPSW